MRILTLAVIVLLSACSHSDPPPAAPADSGMSPATSDANPPALDSRRKLVAFGDSLTAGFGAPAGASYPDFLQKLIDAKKLPWQVINAGVSGDTTTGGLARLTSVLEYKPEIVILELGANDGLRGLPVTASRENLEEMVTALRGAGTKVVLAGMTLPPNYGPDYIKPFERMYTDLAAKHDLKLIPFLLAGVGGNASLMQHDGLHPTAEGNQRVAANVMKVVEPLLTR